MQRLLQCMNAVLQTKMIKKLLLFVGSPLFRWINHYLIEFEQKYSQIKRFRPNGSSGLPVVEDCKPCKKHNPPGAVLTVDDIEMVVEKLGMGTFCEEIETPCDVLEDVSHLLEQKEASLEELREAFAVFDQDGDGFISVIELQEVMCRLELAEGMKLEDCKKMIKSVDRNGDGKVDFYEFKDMLEHVN
ncbi:hypothetical protein MRB53_008322 [Persea americana]|uniref:Uncharacterized protein n=1 Tax=Persea americana TaxID=3435 RepID=A0ACC2MML7_PERAE|nr:hypothetical protein MRB53_008322 [Persea americana]